VISHLLDWNIAGRLLVFRESERMADSVLVAVVAGCVSAGEPERM